MAPSDHNKTLVVLYSLLAGFFSVPIICSPWIIAKNLKHTEQIPITVVVGRVVIFLAMLFLSTSVALYRRKAIGRKLAIFTAVLLLPLCWPIGLYSWWFMHSEGGKKLYPETIV